MYSKSIRIFLNHTTCRYDVVLCRGRISDVLASFDTEIAASHYVTSITGNGRNVSVYLNDSLIRDIQMYVDGKNLSDKIRNCIEFYFEKNL